MKKSSLLKLMNFWPPFMGAGIRVDHMASDYSRIEVSMKLRFWNSNYVNTHYGGSLYSMTDPFYMLMLMQILGRDYIVWDKAASIKFKKPGKGKVKAVFELPGEFMNQLRIDLDNNEKVHPVLTVNIVDEVGDTVAVVEKTLYIKKKK